MAPDSRSPSPIGLTPVDAWQETFSDQDFARAISCFDSPNTPRPKVSPSPSEDYFPQKNDVLCGRDREAYGHAGNMRFRLLISLYRDNYQNAKARDIKTSITKEIVGSIREWGGRFLRKNEQGMWNEVGDDYAHDKVSHALRSAKDPERKPPRRTQKGNNRPPTPEEDNDFERLLADQQHIFRELLEENDMSEFYEGGEQW